MSGREADAAPAKPAKTRVHNAKKLAGALGLSGSQWIKARFAALVPDPDRAAGTWSGPLVDELLARAEAIRASLPDILTRAELIAALQLQRGEAERAENAGLIPAGDLAVALFSRASAQAILDRREQLRSRIPAQPLGPWRCAGLLREQYGLDVHYEDVQALAEAGYTAVLDEFRGTPLYDVDRLRALDEDGRLALGTLVAEREAWIAGSITARDAAAWLRWDLHDLARVAAERGIAPGRDGRYARTEIAALTRDEDLAEQVRRDQLLGPRQAAVHMQIRDTDFAYVRGAHWVEPADWAERPVGRRKTVDVPLFRVGDLEDALEIPGVDWEAVRAAKAGEPSPLRVHARKAVRRAEVIHGFCGALSERFDVEVWPYWANASDTWEIDWEQDEDGHPTRAEAAALLAAHPGTGPYRAQVVLSTQVGEVIRWARRMQRPGVAVVLDTETTGLTGVAIEVAVVDAATGEVLLDTLVDPAGMPVEPGARAVHGITDAELAGALPWSAVYPRFLAAVAGRICLAYNAPFDRDRIAETHAHAGLDAALPTDWQCLMRARTTRERLWRNLPLGGGHRARGDAVDALGVLRALGTVGRRATAR